MLANERLEAMVKGVCETEEGGEEGIGGTGMGKEEQSRSGGQEAPL